MIRSNPVCPDSRVEKEAWSLTKAGYDVHILAWDRSGNHDEEESSIKVADVEILITRFGHKAAFGAGMRSIVPYLSFQWSINRWLRKHRTEYDAVHACDFDTAFFSYRYVLKEKKKFVFDIFDILVSNPDSFFRRCIFKAEHSIIPKADAVIICTESRKSQLREYTPKKLAVIHNTPMEQMLPREGTEVFRVSGDKVKVVYVGILQENRMLIELLDYFKSHPEMEFHVGGFGRLEESFIKAAQEHQNIFFYGKIPYENTLELENKCDIMLAIYNPALENHRNAAPNKFYESLMLGKPVIMVKGTGMSDIVLQHGIGELIDYSEESFSEGLERLIKNRDNWGIMSERMKELYRENYDWSEMGRRLTDLYSTLFSE